MVALHRQIKEISCETSEDLSFQDYKEKSTTGTFWSSKSSTICLASRITGGNAYLDITVLGICSAEGPLIPEDIPWRQYLSRSSR